MKRGLVVALLILFAAGLALSQTTRNIKVGPKPGPAETPPPQPGEHVIAGSGPGGGTPPREVYTDSWALIIAIDNYRFVPTLKYAVADAEAIRQFLVTNGGFNRMHVLTLYNERATKADIETALGTYFPGKVGPNDRVLVYYAGHGQTMDLPGGGQMGYLIPVEGQADNLHGTCLSMSQIRETSMMIKSKHILYVVDACYSGIVGNEARPITVTDKSSYLKKLASQRVVQVITAGQKDQTVMEGQQFGGGHSVFTAAFLSGLNEGKADLNGDGMIPSTELFAYLSPQVKQDSQGHQTPRIYNMDGEGEFVFFTVAKGRAATVSAEVAQSLDSMADQASGDFKNWGGSKGSPEYHPPGTKGGPMVLVSGFKFYIDKYEVTNGDYQECVKTKGCHANHPYPGLTDDKQPVVGVACEDAAAYCKWANKRMPTAEEWTQAGRGNDRRTYPWGDEALDCSRANFSKCGKNASAPVGSYPDGASAFGAMDMVGNVWEWTDQNFQGQCDLRGGSWGANAKSATINSKTFVMNNTPESEYYGFRCALDE